MGSWPLVQRILATFLRWVPYRQYMGNDGRALRTRQKCEEVNQKVKLFL